METGLPEWLDIKKIAELSVLVIAVMQYIKASLPEKSIRYVTVAVGILISILSSLYIGQAIAWSKTIVNGIFAAILADVGYSFLSNKPTSLSLPSKNDLTKP